MAEQSGVIRAKHIVHPFGYLRPTLEFKQMFGSLDKIKQEPITKTQCTIDAMGRRIEISYVWYDLPEKKKSGEKHE